MVAERFGTRHQEVQVAPNIRDDLSEIAYHYDEPFADPSAVPTYYVSKAMRSMVKVALCGDGGDESFAGYDRYRAARWYRLYRGIPRPVRDSVIPAALDTLPVRGWERSHWLHRIRLFVQPGEETVERRYGQWLSHFAPRDKAWICTVEFHEQMRLKDSLSILESRLSDGPKEDLLQRLLNGDLVTYLPDDLLVKMDIASMAHGLEVRAPFLDHPLVEFATSLPARCKIRWGKGKYILRQAFSGLLPAEILRRRKKGFTPPIARWIQEDLREMVLDLLTDTRARQRGYFLPDRVQQILDEHFRCIRNRHYQIWNLLMLELWHRQHVDQTTIGQGALP
jgi:asparagine synthase (glutamine-hydrolysing)